MNLEARFSAFGIQPNSKRYTGRPSTAVNDPAPPRAGRCRPSTLPVAVDWFDRPIGN